MFRSNFACSAICDKRSSFRVFVWSAPPVRDLSPNTRSLHHPAIGSRWMTRPPSPPLKKVRADAFAAKRVTLCAVQRIESAPAIFDLEGLRVHREYSQRSVIMGDAARRDGSWDRLTICVLPRLAFIVELLRPFN